MPPGRSQSTRTIHSDTVATSSAVTPEGTVRSAMHTPPFPIHNSKKPVMKDIRQCAAVGRTPVFHRRIGYKIKPVIKWRQPASSNGGNDSMATRMARYVDPHTKYTNANAIMTSVETRAAGCSTLAIVGAASRSSVGGGNGVGLEDKLIGQVSAVQNHIGKTFLRKESLRINNPYPRLHVL
jgi:hypothetical protein